MVTIDLIVFKMLNMSNLKGTTTAIRMISNLSESNDIKRKVAEIDKKEKNMTF